MPRRQPQGRVRYAVVGLGHIDQNAVLPAFEHAQRNSELVALVSEDPEKLAVLGSVYDAPRLLKYDEFDALVAGDEIDAVFIGLPNSMHADYAVRALRQGVHVLCEKPMAIGAAACREMLRASEEGGARLMIAYRLHFEPATLQAIEAVRSGRLGDPRIFDSVFAMQVAEGNIRTRAHLGGGPLYDIGVYCINAARSLFADEPEEVFAWEGRSGDRRFAEIEETVGAVLRFPQGRIATFAVSFGAATVSAYRIVGTEGDLRVEPGYGYGQDLRHHLTIGDRQEERGFPRTDQFAAELAYFSGCVLEGREPEPSGREGLADVLVIEALHRSLREGRPVRLDGAPGAQHPAPDQEIRTPEPQEDPVLINVEPPSRG